MRRVLVTGSAGFIGSFVCHALLRQGDAVLGYDGVTDYYDPALKRARLAQLARHNGFQAVEARLEDTASLEAACEAFRPQVIVHLAAQPGVRYSIENPRSYIDSNIVGSFNVLEIARRYQVQHCLMASTSSVYGAGRDMPYHERQKCDTPMSLYAATKKACEALAHSQAHLFGFPVTMFRFFTVYGPWGRPDMALIKFSDAIMQGRPIDVYNHGDLYRDFTYVEDLVEGIRLLIDCPPQRPAASEDIANDDSLSPVAPYRVVNIGNSKQVHLMDFIAALERHLGVEAQKNFLPMQPGDVAATWADCRLLERLTGYRPRTSLDEGVARFVAWYRQYRAET